MPFRKFPYTFHDGRLTDYSVLPGCEVTIHVRLDSHWNEKQDRTVLVRFCAIQNMEAVRSFFCRIPNPDGSGRYVDEVQNLEYDKKRKDVVHLHLTKHGSVEIQSRQIIIG